MRSTGLLASRFAAVGVINTVIDYALFNALYYLLDAALLVAHVTGASVAVVASFLLNRNWTFADTKHHTDWRGQLLRHILTAGSAVAISSVAIWLAYFVLPAYLAKLAAVGVSFAWNFTLSRLWVFRARN